MTVHVVAAPDASALGRRRPALAGAWLVSGATLASGVLTYAFHILAARTLGAEAYGRVAVLWAAVFLVAVVLFRPIEQTVSRALADRIARGEEVASVLRTVAVACAGVAGLAIGVTAALHGTIAHRAFGGDGTLAWLLVAGIGLYALAYFVRGVAGGLRWFEGYGLALVADTLGRVLLSLPLLFVASSSLAGLAVAAGGAAGIALPAVLGRQRVRALVSHPGGRPFALRSAVRFAAPVGVTAAADQLLVNGGPLLVALGGGRAATTTAGVVFAATMLVRIPVFVFQGVAAAILPNLTRLHALEDAAAFRRAVSRSAALCLAFGLAIAAGAAVAGPGALRLLYGPGFGAGRGQLGLLGAGVGCYLAASTVSQALLARASAGAAARAWGATAAIFVAGYVLAPGAELTRIACSFTAAAAAALLLLGGMLLRETRA